MLTSSGGEKGSSLPTLMNDYVSQMQPPVATQWQALVASTTVEQLEADTSAFASQSFDFVGGQKRWGQMCVHSRATRITWVTRLPIAETTTFCGRDSAIFYLPQVDTDVTYQEDVSSPGGLRHEHAHQASHGTGDRAEHCRPSNPHRSCRGRGKGSRPGQPFFL